MKLNFVFTTLLLVAATHYGMGAIPTITGIQPESGPMGTPVVITGTDFGEDMANIEVFFGTVPAAISAITPSTLEVTVPAGAAHDLIVVRMKNEGWTIYSPKPFIVTFGSDGDIATGSFLPSVDLTVGTGANPNNLASGDLDGDGKVDLVTANSAEGTIAVFRNIGSGSSLTASSFETPLSLAVDGTVWAMTVADLNGDGKPEIIAMVTTPQAKVMIFKNTSSATAIAFSPRVEWVTNDIAYGMAVADLDGDAWPEIVVPYEYYGIVSVYKNAVHYGEITAASFSTKVDFTTATNPRDVALGDFDGDSRPDMLVACKGNAVSVFRNLGAGTISPSSFAAKVDFFAGTGPTSIALCDTDRDGKLDVVTSNINSYTLCLNRNLSTPGTIDATSFGPRQEFSTGFQPMKVAVADFDGDGYPDAATAINNASKSVAVFENSNVPGSPLTNFFFPKDDLTAGGNASCIVGADLNGDGKADIATSNVSTGTISIFINNNTRTTPPPVITSFSPDNGNFRDEVVITGQNFSPRPSDNLVKFNGSIAKVTASTNTSLTVSVPGFATTGKITVRVDGFETATSAADFKVFQIPSISSIEPMAGPIGTPVTIHGANFSLTPGENIVYFGATRAVVTGATATALTVSVPAGATYKPISVSVHAMVAYSVKPFTVTFPGGPFTTSMFTNQTTFSGTKYVQDAVVGDLDGDGKPDVLMAGLQSGIAIFRNTSTGGPINSTTLAAKVVVPGTETALIDRLELEDLDVDGKLDLIMTSSEAIVFFKNLSTVGTISFASAVTLQAMGHGRVVISDVDMDGKPDLVYGTGIINNAVYIKQNTSVRGTLSFASPVAYATASNCFNLAVADIDGDGKADIIYPGTGSVDYVFSVSVLRNQSTPLSIDANSLAAYVPFPVTSAPMSVAPADFDGDGKTDIAAGCYGYSGLNVLSALQNTSTPGSISASSFAPKTVWSLPSSTNALRAADLDGDGKPEMVLPVCDINCSISVFRNISSPGTPLVSSFEARQDIGTSGNEEMLEVADLNGDGRPELITTTYAGSNIYDLIVLENKSTATYITTFTPASGPVGTVVTITGNNFNATASMNQVNFNGTPAQVTQASTTSLTVVVPDNATTGLISITANSQTVTSATPFTVTNAQTTQTITFNSLSPQLVNGAPFVLNATASSGLPVEYASSNQEVATVSGNVVTLVGHGTTIITASQPGNASYSAAEPVSQKLTVNKLSQTITFDALPEKIAGDDVFVLAGTASSGLPVTYVSGDARVAEVAGNLVEIIGAGTTTLTAQQEGNAVFLEAVPVIRTLVVKEKDVVLGVPGAIVRTNLILPNPVQAWATVSLGEVKRNAPVRIQICDAHGLLVMDNEFESGSDITMDLSQLKNGIYIIQAGQDQSVSYWSRFAVIH